mmetsp:Transcript_5649/g.14055  ORF Transcript_5649/g.14055 Transcript_5649/m.14055 type:complete len:268 (-) Transcript_5649:667-1470(-)
MPPAPAAAPPVAAAATASCKPPWPGCRLAAWGASRPQPHLVDGRLPRHHRHLHAPGRRHRHRRLRGGHVQLQGQQGAGAARGHARRLAVAPRQRLAAPGKQAVTRGAHKRAAQVAAAATHHVKPGGAAQQHGWLGAAQTTHDALGAGCTRIVRSQVGKLHGQLRLHHRLLTLKLRRLEPTKQGVGPSLLLLACLGLCRAHRAAARLWRALHHSGICGRAGPHGAGTRWAAARAGADGDVARARRHPFGQHGVGAAPGRQSQPLLLEG